MQYFKRSLLAVAYALLPLLLLAFGLLLSAHQVFGTPDHIKSALRESGIYDVAVTDLIQEGQRYEDGSLAAAADEIPTEEPGISAAIEKSFPPSLIETQFNKVLDGTYAWIQGDSKDLAFEIDLSAAQPQLADNLAAYATERATTLPSCPADTALPPSVTDFDPFNATCRPLGVEPAMAGELARQKIMKDDFLGDAKLNANDFRNEQGQSLSTQLSQVPDLYGRLVASLYVTGLLAATLVAAGILLANPRRAGVRKIGIIVLVVGIVSTLFAWLSSFITTKIVDAVSDGGTNEALQVRILEAVQLLIGDFKAWWMGFGIVLIVLGIVVLVGLRYRKQSAPTEQSDGTETPTETQETTPNKLKTPL